MYLVALAPMIRYLEPSHNPSLATRRLNVYCEIHLLPCIKCIIALFMHPSWSRSCVYLTLVSLSVHRSLQPPFPGNDVRALACACLLLSSVKLKPCNMTLAAPESCMSVQPLWSLAVSADRQPQVSGRHLQHRKYKLTHSERYG